MADPITDNIAVWTAAQTPKGNGGRGNGNGAANKSAYGIKKLRELILELAVRGKLVPQDPNDEPASVLLTKIAKEKEWLAKDGRIKKQGKLPDVSEEERSFELPQGWEWARLTDLYYSISPSGKKLKTSEINVSGNFPVVDQGKTYIAGYTDASDLVIEIPNPVIIFGDHTTEIKYVDFNFVAGADGTKILCPYKMDERFFYTCLLSYKLENRGYARHFKVLNENFMALPPLSEQHRIVAKVDELMALCDRLEERQNENDAAHQALVETLLATLTATANQGEFADAWQRIANYFATLFTTEHSIDQLKQTILQLAVMGKLVPQGPNDEPASVLLEKIAQEKARLVREGKIRKQEKLPDVGEDEKPFDLPIGWAWTRLGLFCEIKGGKRLPAGHTFSPVETPYLYIQVTNMKDGGITQDNLKYLSADTKSLISKYIISKDNLYITIAGTIGAVGMVPEYFDGMNLTENAAKIVFKDVDKAWLQKALSSEVLQRQFLDKTNQLAQPKLALHRVASSCIALPPLAEQHRIVAKVDELMALCDGLKARLKEAQTTQVQLADAVVEQAVA